MVSNRVKYVAKARCFIALLSKCIAISLKTHVRLADLVWLSSRKPGGKIAGSLKLMIAQFV